MLSGIETAMQALLRKSAKSFDCALVETPCPELRGDDWVLAKVAYAGAAVHYSGNPPLRMKIVLVMWRIKGFSFLFAYRPLGIYTD